MPNDLMTGAEITFCAENRPLSMGPVKFPIKMQVNAPLKEGSRGTGRAYAKWMTLLRL